MDILEHLTQEHRTAATLLERLAGSEAGAQRDRTVAELDEALTIHMTVEEMFLYPMAAKVVGSEEIQEANNEHNLARDGLAALRDYEDEPGFGAAVEMLKGGITHHVHDEESELFPELRRRAADRLAAMDPEQLEQEARAAVGGGRRGGGNRRRADSEATRDELYARAKAANIAGRSQMTKDQLAEALRRT